MKKFALPPRRIQKLIPSFKNLFFLRELAARTNTENLARKSPLISKRNDQ